MFCCCFDKDLLSVLVVVLTRSCRVIWWLSWQEVAECIVVDMMRSC